MSGIVTFDGKPLAKARLTSFEPVEGGRASVGETDANGRYELTYIRKDKGAKVGSHCIRITAANSDEDKAEVVPPQYNRQTTLRAEVKPGTNECNFSLASR